MIDNQLSLITPYHCGAVASGQLQKAVLQPTIILVNLGFAQPHEAPISFHDDVAVPIYVPIVRCLNARSGQHICNLHGKLVFTAISIEAARIY